MVTIANIGFEGRVLAYPMFSPPSGNFAVRGERSCVPSTGGMSLCSPCIAWRQLCFLSFAERVGRIMNPLNGMVMVMRLSAAELDIVRKAFKAHFEANDQLWLFGSRVDDAKRGGDFDFYIETEQAQLRLAIHNEQAFVGQLWRELGEQKIDTVLKLTRHPDNLPIYKIAKATGVRIV